MAAADNGEGSYSLGEEIELLEAIYIHELTVEGPRESPTAVSVLLHPSTGDEEHKRFVCLTLVIHLPQEYPSKLPSIHIKTPRGLSEAHIKSILSNLRELAETCLGRPMLYELIEYAKESLTDNNMPSCACAICLCHFQDSHEFTKTECYHYFHCGCLARYIEFSLQQEDKTEDTTKVECPMCRLPITYNLTELQTVASIEVKEEEIVYKPSEDIRKLQKKMASLFDKQKKKGGVIDVEQERNRFLIDITSVRQEETFPESQPEDTVKTNPVTEPSTNNAPKRPDVAKENNEPNEPIRNDKPERLSVRNDKPERPSVRYDKPERHSVRNDKPERHSVRNDKPERPSVHNDKPERPSVRYDKPERPSVHNDKPERPSVRNDKPERPSVRYDKPERPSVRNDIPERPSVRKDKPERPSVRNDKPERPFRNADKTDRREKKDFPKNSRTSRGPRTPFDRSGNRSGEEKVKQHEQRRTEKKRPVVDDRPRSTDQKDREKVVKKFEEEGKSCAPCADVKQVNSQTQLQPDKNPSVVHLSEKVAKAVSATSSNRSPTQNSNDERPRSARRGRGRSGRGRTSGGSKNEFQDGGKDLNKNTTSWGEGVQQTARTRPSGSVKTNLEKNACTQGQETDLKENPKDKKTCTINKDRAHRPPPGFENVVVDKGECEQTTNDSRPPPPGFEKRSTRPRPPPGLGKPVEGAGPSTSQSITS